MRGEMGFCSTIEAELIIIIVIIIIIIIITIVIMVQPLKLNEHINNRRDNCLDCQDLFMQLCATIL